MMKQDKKAILISIKPEWVEKILNGKKTIEIRRTMPKCDLPIDVYIYCTKPNRFPNTSNGNKTQILTLDESTNKYRLWRSSYGTVLNGKVVAKFTLNKVSDVLKNYKRKSNGKTYVDYISNCGEINWCQKACFSPLELENYLSLKNGYAWHIDNLQIFDNPMELSEFYRNNWLYIFESTTCDKYDCEFKVDNSILGDDGFCRTSKCPKLRVKKAPQSWQYVNVVE